MAMTRRYAFALAGDMAVASVFTVSRVSYWYVGLFFFFYFWEASYSRRLELWKWVFGNSTIGSYSGVVESTIARGIHAAVVHAQVMIVG